MRTTAARTKKNSVCLFFFSSIPKIFYHLKKKEKNDIKIFLIKCFCPKTLTSYILVTSMRGGGGTFYVLET